MFFRNLKTLLDANSAATGITFSFSDDDGGPMGNATGSETGAGDWNQDDDGGPPPGTVSFLTICLIVSFFLMPLACYVYFRSQQQRSIQPVDASGSASVPVSATMSKEDKAKRLVKLKEQLANGEVQKVSILLESYRQ